MTPDTVHKGIDDIAVRNEQLETEVAEQQGKNVLGANALESLVRVIPVDKLFLLPLQYPVIAVGRRQFPPEFVHDFESFGPALMAVAADHVGDDEAAVRLERRAHLFKQPLQIDDMVQRLHGQHGVIFAIRLPAIKVALDKAELGGNAVLLGGRAASFQHGGVQIQALNDEIRMARGQQMPRKINFNIAVPGTHADKAQRPARFAQALPYQVPLEHVVGGADPEGFEPGANLAVGPIMRNFRKIVNNGLVPEYIQFPEHPSVVVIVRLRHINTYSSVSLIRAPCHHSEGNHSLPQFRA